MILDVQGIFAGKWVKLKYRIPLKILEDRLAKEELFDYTSLEEFEVGNTHEENLELLKRYPDDIEMVSGGRLDIIARTNSRVLFDLSDYRLQNDNLTLLERLIEVLKNIDEYPKIEEAILMQINITNIGDALNILRGEEP